MVLSVAIYKEKKSDRLVILPSGRNKIGLIQYKNYGIVSYTKNISKIGSLILWVLTETNDELLEEEIDEKNFNKYFFNSNSFRNILLKYNTLDFEIDLNEEEKKYLLYLYTKEKNIFSIFKDTDGNRKEYYFNKLPTALELGTKVMELFKFKEKYDEENGL